jgi:hypothetical protein
MEKTVKKTIVVAAILIVCVASATGQAKKLANDPLTGLALIPATIPPTGVNDPDKMPDAQVCKSKMQGNFYSLYKIKINAAADWYAFHLSGFKKVQGYESERGQIAFYNADRTTLVILTGSRGAQGENTDAYAVAYERFQPGLAEKTVASLTQGKITCQRGDNP